jgi:hypothetical protein
LFVESNGLRIKVEVNFVFRGTVLPVTQRPLMPIERQPDGPLIVIDAGNSVVEDKGQ